LPTFSLVKQVLNNLHCNESNKENGKSFECNTEYCSAYDESDSASISETVDENFPRTVVAAENTKSLIDVDLRIAQSKFDRLANILHIATKTTFYGSPEKDYSVYETEEATNEDSLSENCSTIVTPMKNGTCSATHKQYTRENMRGTPQSSSTEVTEEADCSGPWKMRRVAMHGLVQETKICITENVLQLPQALTVRREPNTTRTASELPEMKLQDIILLTETVEAVANVAKLTDALETAEGVKSADTREADAEEVVEATEALETAEGIESIDTREADAAEVVEATVALETAEGIESIDTREADEAEVVEATEALETAEGIESIDTREANAEEVVEATEALETAEVVESTYPTISKNDAVTTNAVVPAADAVATTSVDVRNVAEEVALPEAVKEIDTENESDVVLSETVPEVLAITKIMNHQLIEKGIEGIGEDEEEKNIYCNKEEDLAAELPDITDIYDEKDILNRTARRKNAEICATKRPIKRRTGRNFSKATERVKSAAAKSHHPIKSKMTSILNPMQHKQRRADRSSKNEAVAAENDALFEVGCSSIFVASVCSGNSGNRREACSPDTGVFRSVSSIISSSSNGIDSHATIPSVVSPEVIIVRSPSIGVKSIAIQKVTPAQEPAAAKVHSADPVKANNSVRNNPPVYRKLVLRVASCLLCLLFGVVVTMLMRGSSAGTHSTPVPQLEMSSSAAAKSLQYSQISKLNAAYSQKPSKSNSTLLSVQFSEGVAGTQPVQRLGQPQPQPGMPVCTARTENGCASGTTDDPPVKMRPIDTATRKSAKSALFGDVDSTRTGGVSISVKYVKYSERSLYFRGKRSLVSYYITELFARQNRRISSVLQHIKLFIVSWVFKMKQV
jgi:hypothetical protein